MELESRSLCISCIPMSFEGLKSHLRMKYKAVHHPVIYGEIKNGNNPSWSGSYGVIRKLCHESVINLILFRMKFNLNAISENLIFNQLPLLLLLELKEQNFYTTPQDH